MENIFCTVRNESLEFLSIRDHPELAANSAEWFHSCWHIPLSAYSESTAECIDGNSAVPQWYIVRSGEKIVAGLGVIENDFHDRKDLTPNVCAVFVDEEYRCCGIAGQMLDFVCKDMSSKGIRTLYLLTDHTSFYERYGWKYLCPAMGDGESEPSRMYIKETE